MVYISIQGWHTLLTLKTSDEDNIKFKKSLVLSWATFCSWIKIGERARQYEVQATCLLPLE
jgi:hypothetical protein